MGCRIPYKPIYVTLALNRQQRVIKRQGNPAIQRPYQPPPRYTKPLNPRYSGVDRFNPPSASQLAERARALNEAVVRSNLIRANRARAAANYVRPARIFRAARIARLAGLASASLLTPAAALAAGFVALGAGTYVAVKQYKKYLQSRTQVPEIPVADTPKPDIDTPVLAPSKPSPIEMAPRTPRDKNKSTVGPRNPIRVPKFKPVSSITTAPVAIGNTIRGAQLTERAINRGHIVTGRDFMFAPLGSGTISTWTLVGGCPLSPTSFADSNMRQYSEMYNKFRFLSFTAHYITSSPTSNNGDVMLYYSKNRESPFINQTSTNLLPYVMSDPNAVLGPQWQNISAKFEVTSAWKSLDVGMEGSPKDYADGELFLLSKTSSTDSPGYVIFDYEIQFGEKSIQPRLLTLPITRQIYNEMYVNIPTGATVINTPYLLRITGNNISGSPSAYPVGQVDGDIYKVIVDLTNSGSNTNPSYITTSLIGHEVSGSTIPLVMSDGFTCYAVFNATTNGYYLYANAAGAFAGSPNRIFWASNTGVCTQGLHLWMSYVGSVNYTLANVSNI